MIKRGGDNMECEPGKWIPCALSKHKEGSLRRQLHVPKDEKIPTMLLRKVMKTKVGIKIRAKDKQWITVTKLMRKRANLALVLRGFK
jgi:hypothetical protein